MKILVVLAVAASALCACITPGVRVREEPAEDGYSFVDVGDAWLRVRVTGPKDNKKTPVLLLHGFGSRLETWARVHDALDDDRVVVSFDHKGFGHSERPDGDYGPAKHAADAARVLEVLGLDSAVVAGHSYGGGVALRMAVKTPERVRGLVLVDAFALEEQVPSSFRMAKLPGVGEVIFSTLFTELPGEKYILAFHDGQRWASAKALDEIHALQSREGSTYAQLATVRGMDYASVEQQYPSAAAALPRVVVWGDKDKVTPLRQGRALAAAIDAPLVVIPDCGHVPTWERPSLVIKAFRDVLAEADSSPPRVVEEAKAEDVEDAEGDD